MSKKHLWEAIATLVGYTVGAGILGIPFVVAKAGFWTGIIDILIIAAVIIIINLYLGEIVLRTKGNHQLTGYAARYLGKPGKYIMTFSVIFGMTGALIAYIIKEGEFLAAIFSPYLGGTNLIYSLIFFAVMGFLVYKGLRIIERSELYMVFIVIAIIIILFIITFPSIKTENLTNLDITKSFIPYGVILFAFAGMGAIPEVREELTEHKYLMKRAIIIGGLIPLAIYLLFTFIFVGIAGTQLSDAAILGIKDIVGAKIYLFGLFFGILAMSTSFLAVGLALKETYNFDLKINKKLSWLLACVPALIVALIMLFIKMKDAFFNVINLVGAVATGTAGIIVTLMIWKAKKHGDRESEYSIKGSRIIGVILVLLFLLGIIYEICVLLGIIKI